jgi:hypothetical protein
VSQSLGFGTFLPVQTVVLECFVKLAFFYFDTLPLVKSRIENQFSKFRSLSFTKLNKTKQDKTKQNKASYSRLSDRVLALCRSNHQSYRAAEFALMELLPQRSRRLRSTVGAFVQSQSRQEALVGAYACVSARLVGRIRPTTDPIDELGAP